MKNIQLISNLVFHFKNGSNQFTSLILQFNFLIFVLILISTLFNTATAQTWEIADANFDTDEKLYFDDMEFFNNDVGFILAFENDRMFKTTDGGYNWYTDYKLLDSRIGDFYKLNNQIGWIIYSTVDSSVLMKTTDAGESWESLTLPHIVSNIYFVNVQKGFLTGDTTFLKTTDGGTNWEEQIINIPGKTKRLHWIIPKFLNEDFGYALANNGEDSWSGTPFSYFLKTTNSEDDWEVNSFSSPMPISGFHLINFISEDVGILTHWAYLYYTIDGGDNWIKCNDSKFSSFFMNDFSFRNNECWMVGADGFIITSIDSGKTWLNQYSPTDESINSITFTEEKGIAISISNLLFYDLMVSVEDNITHSETALDINPSVNLYPNPTNSMANIRLDLPQTGIVDITIYSLTGSLITKLHSGYLDKGRYDYKFRLDGYVSGIYLCAVKFNNKISTISKLVHLK